MEKLTIDLGKGLILSAPIKLNMTIEEWIRMTNYLNSIINLNSDIKLKKR